MSRRGPWMLVALMAATVAALLAALLLTRGGDDVDAGALLEAAPAAVDDQGRAHLTMTVELDSDAITLSVDGTGAVDFGSGHGWFTVELPGQTVEMRTNGDTLFVLPQGETTWLAVHADEAGTIGSLGAGPGEVIAFVDLLRGTVGEVDDLGEEEIDGRETQHLRLTIDLDTALAEASDQSRASIEALAQLAPDGVLPFEVWIDDRNLPVRQRVRGALQGVAVIVTVDLTDWGDGLGVDIPPEGAVRDIEPEELTRIFGGSAPGER